MCLTQQQRKTYDRLVFGKKGSRVSMKWFHDHGYGNAEILHGSSHGGYGHSSAGLDVLDGHDHGHSQGM